MCRTCLNRSVMGTLGNHVTPDYDPAAVAMLGFFIGTLNCHLFVLNWYVLVVVLYLYGYYYYYYCSLTCAKKDASVYHKNFLNLNCFVLRVAAVLRQLATLWYTDFKKLIVVCDVPC